MSDLTESTQVVNGGDIHYYHSVKRGTQPFVLVHGIAVSSRYMLPLAAELAKTNSVYALDLPGFGKSSKLSAPLSVGGLAAAVNDFIQSLEITEPVLVANSFGCQVVLSIIKNQPSTVSRAVLIGPTMNIYERSSIQQSLRWLQNLKHEPTTRMSFILLKDLWDCGILRVFKTLKIGIKDQPEYGLDRVTAPILFVRGGRDPIAPIEWLQYLVHQNKLFSSAELPEAGHAVNFNSPKPLARIIHNFLQQY